MDAISECALDNAWMRPMIAGSSSPLVSPREDLHDRPPHREHVLGPVIELAHQRPDALFGLLALGVAF